MQLYLNDPPGAQEPPLQLKAFHRVFLQPGQQARVTLTLNRRSFAAWSTAAQGWTVAPGRYRILVGSSSRDIRLRGFFRPLPGPA